VAVNLRAAVVSIFIQRNQIMNRLRNLALGLLTSVSALALSSTALARPETVTTPNRALLHSGVVTLAASYVPAFIVGVESPRPVDRNLFVPVAGPWIDLANRGCGGCSSDRLNKVLLVTDGVFQGIGALNIVGAFLFPEVRVVAFGQSTKVAFTPSRFPGGGYGLGASGKF
jgi:hypothetical protein